MLTLWESKGFVDAFGGGVNDRVRLFACVWGWVFEFLRMCWGWFEQGVCVGVYEHRRAGRGAVDSHHNPLSREGRMEIWWLGREELTAEEMRSFVGEHSGELSAAWKCHSCCSLYFWTISRNYDAEIAGEIWIHVLFFNSGRICFNISTITYE